MKRKRLSREESKRQTKKYLLQAAAKVFAEQGFHGASVDEIAEAAGYTKGAIYNHFNSKEDLFLALFDQNQAEDIQALTHLMEQSPPFDEFIQSLESFHELERSSNYTWSLLKMEFFLYAMRQESARHKLAKSLEETRNRFAVILKSYFDNQPIKPPFDANELAWLILSLDLGFGMQYYVDQEKIPTGLYARGLSRILKSDEQENPS